MNHESVTVALRKFRVQKKVETGKGPLTATGFIKLIQLFEETGTIEDRVTAVRPCLRKARLPHVAIEMEASASKSTAKTSSAREDARGLGLPPSSVRKYSSWNPSFVPIDITVVS